LGGTNAPGTAAIAEYALFKLPPPPMPAAAAVTVELTE